MIIPPPQLAFVPRRAIQDNVIITHDLFTL